MSMFDAKKVTHKITEIANTTEELEDLMVYAAMNGYGFSRNSEVDERSGEVYYRAKIEVPESAIIEMGRLAARTKIEEYAEARADRRKRGKEREDLMAKEIEELKNRLHGRKG